MTPALLSVLVFPGLEEGQWVAQGLELDFATQHTGTLAGMLYEIARIVAGHVMVAEAEQAEPWQLPAGPKGFWREWESAEPLEMPDEYRLGWTSLAGRAIPLPKIQVRVGKRPLGAFGEVAA